jgi:excisionase family DNA binding protein
MLIIDLLLNIIYNKHMKNKDEKIFFSTYEVAKFLKISRIAVFNKIKQGLIQAEKIGRNYAIPREEIEHLLGDNKKLSEKSKEEINMAVERAVKEYGQAIRMLGKE